MKKDGAKGGSEWESKGGGSAGVAGGKRILDPREQRED